MSDCKTGAEHLRSLQDGRTVYLDGELVKDVTEHKAFRNAVRSAAAQARLARPLPQCTVWPPNGRW